MKKFLVLFILFLLWPIFILVADKVDINTALLSQLDEIAHVGDKTAQKIIDGRPYGSVQDLSKIKGIGNGKYLQDIISQGVACVNCATQISPAQILAPVPESKVQAPSPAPEITYPSGIVFNEALANPSGADETEEWIELKNTNNFDVDLSDWKIKDTAGTIATFTISKDTKILTNRFLVFKRPETKIMLNNDGDGLNLFTPDGKTEDQMSFTKAPLGQSYTKTLSGWAWSTTVTPGSENIITQPVAVAKTNKTKKAGSSSSSSVNKPTANVDSPSGDLSAASVSNSGSSPWILFFVAVFAVAAGGLIVFFKKILEKRKIA